MKKGHKKLKSNVKIFLLSVVIVLSIVLIIRYKNKIVNIIKKEENPIKEVENKKDDANKEVVTNPYKKITYYKSINLNRYEKYFSKNQNLSYEEVVTYVNIGLDYNFYGYISNTDMTKNNLILVNKYYKLENNYEPSDLETIRNEYFISGNNYVRQLKKEAKEAFEMLSKSSIENGTPVYGQSAYRTYDRQEYLYNKAVKNMGKEAADNDTARPGHSEHQTGLAIDVSSTKSGNMLSFDSTSSYTWMNNNAYKYGFVLRYESNKTSVTGFMYESWHYRYVGIEVATDMHDNYPNLSYDEYYIRFLDN